MNTDWQELVGQYHPTGSRYICSPPVMDTDEDWICLTKIKGNHNLPWKEYENKQTLKEQLIQIGFEGGGSEAPHWETISLKRNSVNEGLVNLIITDDEWEYNKWVIASKLAKRFNLTNKEDRIAVFEAVVKHNISFEYYTKVPEDWL
jgi:hypothetical protein